MEDQFTRIRLVIGEENVRKLRDKNVLIFGLGGVGGYVVEALARSGIGNFTLIDNDTINVTNINRQIIANHNNIGMYKVDVAKERILAINPHANVKTLKLFYLPDCNININFNEYDYVIDAIDTLKAKIDIIEKCYNLNVHIISAMGAGNKMDVSKLQIEDINKTEVDPLARAVRYELRKRNVKHLKVCYSKEIPIKEYNDENIVGSMIFVPACMGLMIANEVLKDLIK